jgi:hypothetical protein
MTMHKHREPEGAGRERMRKHDVVFVVDHEMTARRELVECVREVRAREPRLGSHFGRRRDPAGVGERV